jgi:rare lipoprotein A
MSSISCDRASYVDIEAGRKILMVSSAGVRKAVQLFALAMTAATLAACASSPTAINKTASIAPSQQASPQPNRKASFATNRRVSVAKKYTPFVPNKPAVKNASYGVASFYEEDGSRTANGEQFDGHKLTAAHPTLPFGTRVRVTNVDSGSSVTVRVNDRGPFVQGRVIDVSYAAAKSLGITERGLAKVKLDVVQ